MRRGLNIDVLESPDCRGRLRFAAAIMLSTAVRRILSLEPSIFAQNACRDAIRGRFRALRDVGEPAGPTDPEAIRVAWHKAESDLDFDRSFSIF